MPRTTPSSVNFHLWQPCNMRCRFCFATFQDVVSSVLPKGHLPREQGLRLVESLAPHFRKITFAGGEPLLCPWLPDLMRSAKEHGMVTMLVTNGSRLAARLPELHGHLDWVALSIDSASPVTQRALGRAVHGVHPLEPEAYLALADLARRAGMRVKLNTVVTSINAGESMVEFVRALRPERWKILRVLPVEGQNSGKVEPLLCSDSEFRGFVARHCLLNTEGTVVVAEDNEDMRGSYAMVDPAGRFFDDVDGGHRYSAPILEVGIEAAWKQVSFFAERFQQRGGDYEF